MACMLCTHLTCSSFDSLVASAGTASLVGGSSGRDICSCDTPLRAPLTAVTVNQPLTRVLNFNVLVLFPAGEQISTQAAQ